MTNHASSEDIREDIQETRRDMGRKIDTIQDRLSADNLKAQAREVVNEFATATADSVSEYVRENAPDIGYTLIDAIKKNPLPSALVGLGLGWLFIESMSSDQESSARRRITRYNGDPAFRHGMGYGYSTPNRQTHDPSNKESMGQKVGNSLRNAAENVQAKAEEWTEQTREWAGETVQEAQWRTRQMQDEARLQGHLASMETQDRAAQWRAQGSRYAQQAGHEAGHYASQAAEYAGQSAESVRDYARDTAGQVGAYAHQLGHQAQSYTQDAGAYVRDRAYDAGVQVEHAIEENPLTFGAIALAVGAAVGLMLPQTRRENRWLGPMSDQLADSARGAASDVMHRAQEAIDEVRPDLERTAQKVVNDLQETSDKVTEDVKQAAKSAMDDAKQATQHAQEVASQKAQKAQDDVKERAEEARTKGR
ncbi:MAG: DUF3618 domain-containing protein [Caldilineaceae bacterium]